MPLFGPIFLRRQVNIDETIAIRGLISWFGFLRDGYVLVPN